jgi:hypothetical protein
MLLQESQVLAANVLVAEHFAVGRNGFLLADVMKGVLLPFKLAVPALIGVNFWP